jgi:hypothetical protein
MRQLKSVWYDYILEVRGAPMGEAKTRPTKASVTGFLKGIPDERQRRDALTILAMIRDLTKARPEMWGANIVGFGRYRYTYADGTQAEWPIAAFSPRKRELTLYLTPGFTRYGELLEKLGKHKTGKTCLYIKKLEDVHLPTLKTLIRKSIIDLKRLTT